MRTHHLTKVYSMKFSIKNPNVIVNVAVKSQYQDNAWIAQTITVTKTKTVYRNTINSTNLLLTI